MRSTNLLKCLKSFFKPHLVILDVAMPDMNGFDLYRELKKLDPEVKTHSN
jgi:YesN/AraC family two-component response regulator